MAIHVIEHFYSWEVLSILKEWLRVLKPGGKLVLELPCMDKIVKLISDAYRIDGTVPRLLWDALWGEQKDKLVPMCHKYGYTEKMMMNLMGDAGFNDVISTRPRYHFEVRDMRIEGIK